jgi:hypothetical protein
MTLTTRYPWYFQYAAIPRPRAAEGISIDVVETTLRVELNVAGPEHQPDGPERGRHDQPPLPVDRPPGSHPGPYATTRRLWPGESAPAASLHLSVTAKRPGPAPRGPGIRLALAAQGLS